jgi:hypothetical protein
MLEKNEIEIKDFLLRMIDSLELELINYKKTFVELDEVIKNDVNSTLLKKINFLHERSLAFVMDMEIINFLKKYTETPKFIAELQMQYSGTLNDTSKSLHKSKFSGLNTNTDKFKKLDNKETFIPDAFIYLRNNSIFLEYKVSTKTSIDGNSNSDYLNLAIDYLKFKYYTTNSKNNDVMFAYMIIHKDKKENELFFYPTLKIENREYNVKFLEDRLTKDDISHNTSIYLFNPKKLPSINFRFKVNKNIEAILNLSTINDLLNNFSEDEKDPEINYDYFDYASNFKFGKSVLLAKNIKNSFYLIDELDKMVTESLTFAMTNKNEFIYMNSKLPFSSNDYLKEDFDNKEDFEIFVYWLSDYFDNQIIKKSRNLPNSSEFNFSLKRSL